MFHFPALPPPALCVQAGATAIYGRRVSPFGNPRITVWLPTPRGLSQAPTSFIGSWCQGIHRAPLITWQHSLQMHYPVTLTCDQSLQRRRCSRPLCSSQDTDGTKPRDHIRDHGNPALTEDPGGTLRCRARFPQIPNSVLIRALPRAALSIPAALVKDAGRTSRRQLAADRMNSQCSTRQHERQTSHSLVSGAKCSLERR